MEAFFSRGEYVQGRRRGEGRQFAGESGRRNSFSVSFLSRPKCLGVAEGTKEGAQAPEASRLPLRALEEGGGGGEGVSPATWGNK